MRRLAILQPVAGAETRAAVERVRRVGTANGVEVGVFASSDDLEPFEPDCVLATSCQDAKVTRFPTYGLLTDPVHEYQRSPRLVRNLLTYDAYLTLRGSVSRWLADLTYGARKFSAPVAQFGPTVPVTAGPASAALTPVVWATPLTAARKAAVCGAAAQRDLCRFCGPAGTWEWLDAPNLLCGADGHAADAWLSARAHGMAICFAGGTSADDPPPVALDAIAAGAVVIAERHPWLVREFGDALLYFDGDSAPEATVGAIARCIEWARTHAAAAARKAAAAQQIYARRFAIDALWTNLLDVHSRVLRERGYQPPADADPSTLPTVTYVVRTGGGRPPEMLRRALASLAAQNYPGLKVLLVLFRPLDGVDDLRREFPALAIDTVDDIGGLRSTAIAVGLRAASTDLVGLLDDDDDLYPNHVWTLVRALREHNGGTWRGPVGVAYSASVELGEQAPREEWAEWDDEFRLARREHRVIEHYRFYRARDMASHQWYLMSNSWLVRRDMLDEDVLADPTIHTCEDLYFALQFAQRTRFAFSGEVTAVHRFHGHGNSTILDQPRHLSDTLRIATRSWRRLFPLDGVFRDDQAPFVLPGPPRDGPVARVLTGMMKVHAPAERPTSGPGFLVPGGPVTHAVATGSSSPLPPGAYVLSVNVTPTPGGAWDEVALRMGVRLGRREPRLDLVVSAATAYAEGDSWRVDLLTVVGDDDRESPLDLSFWQEGAAVYVRRVAVRHAAGA